MDEIKKSFRQLAYIYHPDRSTNGREYNNELLLIFEAYSVLSNKEKRRDYDLNLSNNAEYSANDIFNSDKELVNYISNIQFFLTYPNNSNYTKAYFNNEIIKLVNNKSLDLLVNQQVNQIDKAYVNLLLNTISLINYESFVIIYNYLHPKIDYQFLCQLRKIKKRKKTAALYDKYFGLIIIILTIFICFCIFFLVK